METTITQNVIITQEIIDGAFALGKSIQLKAWISTAGLTPPSHRQHVMKAKMERLRDKIQRTETWTALLNLLSEIGTPGPDSIAYFRTVIMQTLDFKESKAMVCMGTAIRWWDRGEEPTAEIGVVK